MKNLPYSNPGGLRPVGPSRAGAWLLGLTAVLLFASTFGSTAADVRAELPVTSDKIFARMLQSAERGEFGRVSQAVDLLEPLSRHLAEILSVDPSTEVRRALKSEDEGQVVRATERYVVLSIRGLLRESMGLGDDVEAIREKLRFLAQEVMVLDPYVKQVEFTASAQIHQMIQQLAGLAGKEPALFRAKAAEFEGTLEKVFPFASQ